jgi:hypothetical protein
MNEPTKTINFNLDPSKTPVLFVDTTLISSSSNALTLSFAQAVLDGQQQTIVARVAMTADQAKNLLKDLNDHIEKFER